MEDAPRTFGAWLKRRRKRLRLTQRELAEAIGYAEVTLRKVEADELRPSREMAQKLAEVLQVPPAERTQFLRFARDQALWVEIKLPESADSDGSPALPIFHRSPQLPPPLDSWQTQAEPAADYGQAATASEASKKLQRKPPSDLAQPYYGSTLPAASAPLIERDADLAYLNNLLTNPFCRLVTITGPGGIGKTRLALDAARQCASDFLNGAVFVDLSGVTDATFLPEAILAALEVPLQRQKSPRQQLRAYLQDLELLVILDNYEQLLPGVDLLAELVRYASGVKWIVTSRERLALQAEHLVELTGLSYPAAGSPDSFAEQATSGYGAVQLFVQRVHQIQPHLKLTADDMAAIARICRVTEGMPLALELAASAVRMQSCAAIAAELEGGRHRLTAHMRDVPERHLSVHSAFGHSWRLLLPEEQRVFQALSVFRSGCQAEAAQEVAGASVAMLETLLDKSLVSYQRQPSGANRYGMHELIRQYAEEKLVEAGRRETAQRAHLAYFLQMAEEAEPKLRTGEQEQWLNQLEREHDNLRAALERAMTYQWRDLAARLAGALSRFWFIRVHVEEGRKFLESLCDPANLAELDVASSSAAKVFIGAGWLAFLQADYSQAVAKFERGLALAEQAHDPKCAADALRGLALQAMNQGNRELAQTLAQASLDVARTAEDSWLAGSALNVLGDLARGASEYEKAAALFAESQALLQAAGDSSRLAIVQGNAGSVALALGDVEGARRLHQAAIRSASATNYVRAVARGLDGLAAVLVRAPDVRQAGMATQLLGAAEAARSRASISLESLDRADYERTIAAAKAILDPASFAAAWAEGQAMPLEQAVAYALAEG